MSDVKQKGDVRIYKNVQVMPVEPFLVRYVDGHGQEETQLGFVVGPDIRFLDFKSLSKPAQAWLRDQIFVALGKKEEAPEVDEVPVPTLERQI